MRLIQLQLQENCSYEGEIVVFVGESGSRMKYPIQFDTNADGEYVNCWTASSMAAEHVPHVGDIVFLNNKTLNQKVALSQYLSNASSGSKLDAIHTASRFNDLILLKELLSGGYDPNYPHQSNNGTPLHFAAGVGHLEIVKTLVAHDANVNPKDHGGMTPLHIATAEGHCDIAIFLIDEGAKVEAVNNQGETPLDLARKWGISRMVNELTGNTMKTHDGNDTSNMLEEVFYGHTETVKALLKAGADPNLENNTDGTTPLFLAAQNGHIEVVKALLEAEANVNAETANGYTPLWQAANKGHTEIVKLLLKSKANVNFKGIDGVTPLWIATQECHTAVVKALLYANADVDIKSKTSSKTALMVAAWEGHTEIVKLLLEAKADVNTKAHYHGKVYTPLNEAESSGHYDIVRLLKEYGAEE